MYSIDLSRITLEEFEEAMRRTQLLPSQRIILNNLSGNMQILKDKGCSSLQDLQNLLKRKNDYIAIAEDTGISQDYLVILNRMVNSYVVKVLPLEKLEIFTNEELNLIAGEKIGNTKQYYEAFTDVRQRESFSAKSNISLEKLRYALHIIDLVRINGVGIEYAKILYDIGVKSVSDYNNTPSAEILELVKAYNKRKEYTKATLGISDVDYCRRFCEKLDCDII